MSTRPTSAGQDGSTRRPPRVLVAGGGTGGHIYIGVALARELAQRVPGAEILFVGTQSGLEARIVPAENFRLEFIRSSGLNRVGARALARGLAILPRSLVQSTGIARRFRPDVAIGVGGYSSGPMVLAAWMLRVPSLVVEPNAYPGFTNRLLGRLVDRAAVAFEEALPYFRGRGVVTGIPVRREFRDLPPRPRGPGLSLLVYGGSQGSHALNTAMCNALEELKRLGPGLRLVHQTGEREWAGVVEAYRKAGFAADVRPFLPRIYEEIGAADLVLSRAGAGTLAELTVSGKPSILVPLPSAADDHQTKNARALERAGGARVVPEAELSPERLAAELRRFIQNPAELEALGAAARRLGRPDAAEHIVDLALGLMRRP